MSQRTVGRRVERAGPCYGRAAAGRTWRGRTIWHASSQTELALEFLLRYLTTGREVCVRLCYCGTLIISRWLIVWRRGVECLSQCGAKRLQPARRDIQRAVGEFIDQTVEICSGDHLFIR